MRFTRWLTWIAVGGLVLYVYREHTNLVGWWQFARHLSWWWVVILILFEAGYYGAHGFVYRQVMTVVGIKSEYWAMLKASLMVIYLNTVLPTVGVSGATPVLEYAARTKQSPGRAATGYVLASATEVIALAVLATIFLLLAKGQSAAWLTRWHLPIVLIFIIFLSFCGLIVFLNHKPKITNWIFAQIRALVNWFRRRLGWATLPPAWSEHLAHSLTTETREMVSHPKALGLALFWSAVAVISEGLLFVATFHALGHSISLDLGLFIYSLIMLVWYVSPTPQGLGFVELVGAFSLTKSGISVSVAVTVLLLFRGFAHWLPAAVGFILYTRRPIPVAQ